MDDFLKLCNMKQFYIIFILLAYFQTALAASDGSNGSLVVDSNVSLTIPTDFTFNFETLTLNNNATLSFNGLTAGDEIFLLATDEIRIDGILNAVPANVFLEAPTIILFGEILSNSVTLTTSSSNNILYSSHSNISVDKISPLILTASTQPVAVFSPILIKTVPEISSLALLLIGLLSLRKFIML